MKTYTGIFSHYLYTRGWKFRRTKRIGHVIQHRTLGLINLGFTRTHHG